MWQLDQGQNSFLYMYISHPKTFLSQKSAKDNNNKNKHTDHLFYFKKWSAGNKAVKHIINRVHWIVIILELQ